MPDDALRPDIIAHNPTGAFPVEQHPLWLRQRLEWFKDQKLGLILHWGPYCQWDCCESWPLVPADAWARPDDLPAWVEREVHTRFVSLPKGV